MMRLSPESITNRMAMAPGVEIGEITVAYAMRLAPSPEHPDVVRVSAAVTGWGPTLHRTLMDWEADAAGPGADQVAAALEGLMAVQRRRADAARRLGFGRIAPRDAGLLDHVVVDRLLKAIKVQAPWDIENAARQLATLGIDGMRTTHRRGNVTFAEGTDEDPRPRALLVATTAWGNYDGATLNIMARVPDSVVPAMAGRLVGEVLTPGDGLEPAMLPVLDRTILSAHLDGTALALATRPDWVPLATPPRRTI